MFKIEGDKFLILGKDDEVILSLSREQVKMLLFYKSELIKFADAPEKHHEEAYFKRRAMDSFAKLDYDRALYYANKFVSDIEKNDQIDDRYRESSQKWFHEFKQLINDLNSKKSK